jgi:hypothetical protein
MLGLAAVIKALLSQPEDGSCRVALLDQEMIRMRMSADEKREFPHWEELYQEHEIESMPWFNLSWTTTSSFSTAAASMSSRLNGGRSMSA